MKQFNLDDYMMNPKRRVVTRGGYSVTIVDTDFRSPDGLYTVVGIIHFLEKDQISMFDRHGRSASRKSANDLSDLFFGPENHEGWINIYQCKNGYYSGDYIHDSKSDAIEYGKPASIATVKIEWED